MDLDVYKIISKYNVGGYRWLSGAQRFLEQLHINPVVDKFS